MRSLIGTVTVVAALALSGCSTMIVSSHIEPGITFADYRTYDWGPPDNLPVGDPRLDNNPFFNDYLQGAVEQKMAARGFDRAAAGAAPDLLIHYHANVRQRVDIREADRQYGYTDDTGSQVVEFDQGTLVIDVVDAKTSKVVWRGWAQDSMTGIIDNQDRLQKQVDEAVTRMMLRLPSGGAVVP